MKIIRNILIGLGVVFLLFMGLAVFLLSSQSEFQEKYEEHVKMLSIKFSQSWEIASVSENFTNQMLSQASTPNGVQA